MVPTGRLQISEHYRSNFSDGLRTKWYPDGRKLSEAATVQGKIQGVFRSWYENGQLREQIEMELGQPEGTALAYYPSGFLKAETTATRTGQVIESEEIPMAESGAGKARSNPTCGHATRSETSRPNALTHANAAITSCVDVVPTTFWKPDSHLRH